MQSLFLKFFLSFWLVVVLISATLAFTFLLGQSKDDAEHAREIDSVLTPLIASRTAEIYEQKGSAALSEYLKDFDKKMPWTPYFFDDRGTQLYGSTPSPAVLDIASRAQHQQDTLISSAEGRKIVAQEITSAIPGHHFVLVLQEDSTAPGARSFLHATPQIQLFRALATVLIIGAVCFALARYMTNPISRLRRVTGELAEGNLNARVAGNVVNRRDELGDLSRDFNFMAEHIQALVLSQRRLTSDISHELRSPLARLSVALGLARRSGGSDANRYLDRIERETERLNELIGNLLKLARLESGVEPQEFEVLDLDALVREVVDDVGFEAQSRNRAVHILHVDQCRAAGRWELLRSAVENVVRNAVIHTAENTAVEITLAVTPDHPADLAIIRVRDHGPGVPAHLLRDIFQPFYRVDESRERSVGGTGLGLSITEHAVTFHQGQIHAENSSQGGLIVEIRLPLIQSA